MFCIHKWVEVKKYKTIYRERFDGIFLPGKFTSFFVPKFGEWKHDERRITSSALEDIFEFKECATATVCIRCGKCGGTIIEAQKHFDKVWAREEGDAFELELAQKIYADNCAGVGEVKE